MNQEGIENMVITVASKSTYTGAGTMLLGWVTSSQFAVIFGLFLGLAGLAVNWYYRYRTDKREAEAHDLRVRRLKYGQPDITDFRDLEDE